MLLPPIQLYHNTIQMGLSNHAERRRGQAMPTKLMTVTQCAEKHGVTRKTIHRAIERGALTAERVGHVWVMTEEACDAYRPIRDPREKGKRAMEVRWGARRRTRPHESDDGDEAADARSGS